jgi:hypothetical protein
MLTNGGHWQYRLAGKRGISINNSINSYYHPYFATLVIYRRKKQLLIGRSVLSAIFFQLLFYRQINRAFADDITSARQRPLKGSRNYRQAVTSADRLLQAIIIKQ